MFPRPLAMAEVWTVLGSTREDRGIVNVVSRVQER
jgi:hypothetical protein